MSCLQGNLLWSTRRDKMAKLTAAKALELLGGGAAGAYTAKRYTDIVGSPQQYQDETGQIRTTPGMSDKQKKDLKMRAAGIGALAVAGPAGLRRMALKRKNRKLMKADLEGIDSAKRKIKEQLDTSYFLSPTRYKKKREFEEGVTLEPNQIGKQFIDGNYLFIVEDINNNDEDKPPLLRWNYRNINP